MWANFEDPAYSDIDRQELLVRLPVENHLWLRSYKPAVAELIRNAAHGKASTISELEAYQALGRLLRLSSTPQGRFRF